MTASNWIRNTHDPTSRATNHLMKKITAIVAAALVAFGINNNLGLTTS